MQVRKGNVRITLTPAQLARAATEHARLQGTATATAPARVENGLRVGQLVAGSMPKHPRVVISKIDHFDRDGEARGIRGEHLGYADRRDNRGNRKLTLCTPVAEDLARTLTQVFPNLNNAPRPGNARPQI